jgi:hypothetical protein
MKAGGFFVGTLLLGNLAVLSGLSLHVVRSPDKAVSFVPKSQLTFVDTYVDTRNWTPQDVSKHPALVARLTDAGKVGLISHVTDDSACCTTTQVIVKHATTPATQPAPHVEATDPSVFDFGRNR